MKLIDSGVPVFCTRYEIIVKDPKSALTDVFEFMFNLESMEGTMLEQRLKEVLEMGQSATRTYKPKTAERIYASDDDMFSEEQKNYVFRELHDFLLFFGYFKPRNAAEEEVGNNWAIYDYPEFLKQEEKYQNSKIRYC